MGVTHEEKKKQQREERRDKINPLEISIGVEQELLLGGE